MHIVNGHMAENIYEQGMVMPPNAFGIFISPLK